VSQAGTTEWNGQRELPAKHCSSHSGDSGLVLQKGSSFPRLTVWDNAAFGLRSQGALGAEIERRMRHMLGFIA